MKHYVSFTSILHALAQGKLTLLELYSDEAMLCFGCAREHLFDNGIPQEVSWLKGNEHQFTYTGCDPAKLNQKSLLLWNRFFVTVDLAEKGGRVKYRIGNYPQYCMERVSEGVPVWWCGWRTWDDYIDELGDKPFIVE